MAAKRRVFQVAREFNISNESLIEYLTKLEYSVKTPMSPITDEMYDEICKKYRREAAVGDADYEFRKRLREKKLEEEKRKERARRELEERIRLAKELAKKPLRKKEPKKEDVLQIAIEEAKREAQAELEQQRRSGQHPAEKGSNEKALREKPPVGTAPQPEEAKPPAPAETVETVQEKEAAKEKATIETPAPQPERVEAKGVPGETVEVVEPPAKEEPGVAEEEKKKAEKVKPKRKKREEAKKRKQEQEEGIAPPEEPKKKKKKRKKKKRKISEEEIEASIKQTIAIIEGPAKPKRRRRKVKVDEEAEEFEEANVIRVTEFISVADLAQLMNVEPNDVLKKCLEMGLMVSINQRLDMETIVMVADEFGFEVEPEEEFAADLLEEDEEDRPEDLQPRPPVVTIMGHVDHGKTSLLDYIRRSNIIAGEAGGITQHIGAYEVEVDGRQITFLDTPGHEAFTAMRARGAQVTDIVVLIVAADDGVQQQTIEAINHAKAAGVPIIVAINKIDRPEANPDMVKQQLSQHGILVEDWGGKHQCAEISAKTGVGVDKLLEAILLEAEILELKANPNKPARGTIIEAELDRGKGAIATVLVQSGTLKIGDPFVAGLSHGKVRAMFDERGKPVKAAPPSTPVRVVGFSVVPQAGDRFVVTKSEKEAKEISLKRQQIHREQELRKVKLRTLDQISKQIQEGEVRELRVIVKGDVDGSIEALADSLVKLSTKEVAVDVIHKAVGGITETDVNLAAASDAIIIGFNVRVTLGARELAEKEDVDIRIYNVIYDAVNDVKMALEGLLEPEKKEEIIGTAEVRQVFKVPKVGRVAGCYVQSGKIRRNDLVRLYREDKKIYEGRISSLKRFKDDVREVQSGFECGLAIEGFDDIHVGDIIECYQIQEVKRSL